MNYDIGPASFDANLVDIWYTDIDNPLVKGLVRSGVYIVTGAPAVNNGVYMPGAMIQNAVDKTWYVMTGTTAACAWTLVETASGVPKTNLTASTAPGVGNDNTQGYSAGSLWFNNNTGLLYVAQSVATGAAVWTVSNNTATVTTKVTLTSAQIKALNGTPIQLLAAPGSGTVYEILAVTGRINFLTAAYDTHTELDIIDATSGNVLYKDASALLASASTVIATIPPIINSNVGVIKTTNGAIQAKAATGNPATGSGTLDLYVTYRVITL